MILDQKRKEPRVFRGMGRKMKKRAEEMVARMTAAGLNEDEIKEICDLEKAFCEECEEIAERCEDEGYPGNGSNYELRVAESRQWYDEQINLISRGRW